MLEALYKSLFIVSMLSVPFILVLLWEIKSCKHINKKVLSSKVIGVTMGLSGKPALSIEDDEQCLDCGHRETNGYVHFKKAELLYYPEYYPNDEFWPVDPDTGDKLPIEENRWGVK